MGNIRSILIILLLYVSVFLLCIIIIIIMGNIRSIFLSEWLEFVTGCLLFVLLRANHDTNAPWWVRVFTYLHAYRERQGREEDGVEREKGAGGESDIYLRKVAVQGDLISSVVAVGFRG